MIDVIYTHAFVRRFKKLERQITNEALKKINLFKDPDNHQNLKVHKLHGEMNDSFSFSVNHKIRIIFRYINNNEVVLTAIDDHTVYK
ncbi:MAG: hypothetical protein Q7R72_01365 [bacterium]|nr:hypothetical protein [bacterium]